MFLKGSFVGSLLLSALADAASIGGINKREDGVYQLDFAAKSKTADDSPLKSNLKTGTYTFPVTNEQLYYLAEIYVGSNKQKVGVNIDSGSADLWVFDSSLASQSQFGSFNTSQSSTFKGTDIPFSIAYGDGNEVLGNFSTDDVSLGEDAPTIKNLQFAVATKADPGFPCGILGIGFPKLESANEEYDNFPVSLKKQGFIKKAAYSLYLNDINATTGSILFGGIDQAKYSGELTKLPFVSDVYFEVDSQGISSKNYSTPPFKVVFDSGSAISYLTPDLLKEFTDGIGAKAGSYYYYFDSEKDVPETLDFKFGGVNITVPREDIIRVQKVADDKGNVVDRFVLLFMEHGDFSIFGDNVLRHAYIVFNLDDKNAQLAPVKYTSDSKITTIE